MTKKGIVIGLIILCSILLVVLVYILATFSNKDNLENDIANSTIINSIKNNNTVNNTNNNVDLNNENISQNLINQNTTENVIKEENKEENTEEIKNIKISILNTPNDILDKIANKDDFAYSLKEFVYINQRTDITQFEYVHSIRLNNKYILYYRANDKIKSYIEVVYNLTTNKTTAEIAKD